MKLSTLLVVAGVGFGAYQIGVARGKALAAAQARASGPQLPRRPAQNVAGALLNVADLVNQERDRFERIERTGSVRISDPVVLGQHLLS